MVSFNDCGHEGPKSTRGLCEACRKTRQSGGGHKGGLAKGVSKKRPAAALISARDPSAGGKRLAEIRKKADRKVMPTSIRAFALPLSDQIKLFTLLRIVVLATAHIDSVVMQGGMLLACYRKRWIQHDDDGDFFLHQAHEKELQAVSWESMHLKCEKVGTGHFLVSWVTGGETITARRGNVRTRVSWPFVEFFSVSFAHSSRKQQKQELLTLHSPRFYKWWPREEWTLKKRRWLALPSPDDTEGEAVQIPCASDSECKKHLLLNYGKNWRTEMKAPIFSHRGVQGKLPDAWREATYKMNGSLKRKAAS